MSQGQERRRGHEPAGVPGDLGSALLCCGWLDPSQGTAVHTRPELRFCMGWWYDVAAREGRAQEEDCADVVDQVQYGPLIAAGGTTTRSNLFWTSIHIRRISSIFCFYVSFGLFYFGLVN